LKLQLEAAACSWPCEFEKFYFFFQFFFGLASRLGPDYEALGNTSLNFVNWVEGAPVS
jgi:hypothetical protein